MINSQDLNEKRVELNSGEIIVLPDKTYGQILHIYETSFGPNQYIYNQLLTDNPIDTHCFKNVIEDFILQLNLLLEKEVPFWIKDDGFKYAQIYLALREEYQTLNLGSTIPLKNENMDLIYHMIDLTYKAHKNENEYFWLRGLKSAKEDVLLNLKYFQSEEQIREFESSYEKAMQDNNIEEMKDLLDEKQNLVLKEWRKFPTSIELLQTADHFSFIGHSVIKAFDGEFHSRFVSCSLYTEDLTDTYRNGFGFILAPENIVGATNRDMYVNNNAVSSETIKNGSILHIDHPQRIIDNCLQLLEQNKKEAVVHQEERKKVYSEIVIDGFQPIGIFCFTDGSLQLDSNYKYALELQEKYPNLKLVAKDIMKNKKGEDLLSMQLYLINRLYHTYQKDYFGFSYTEKDLPRFSLFLQEFEALKAKGNYTEKDIMQSFSHNMKLVNIITPTDLFSGMYTFEEIKYILGKNDLYNIDFILNGDISIQNLSSLVFWLANVNIDLDSFYPGLGTFVKVASLMEFTDEDIEWLKREKEIDFYTIINVLKQKKFSQIKQSNKDKKSELSFALKEKERIENNEKKYQYYQKIDAYASFINMIRKDYLELINEETILSMEKKEMIERKKHIDVSLEKVQLEIRELEQTTYINSEKGLEISSLLMRSKEELSHLRSHRFLNRKKIKTKKQEITKLEIQNKMEEKQFRIDQALKADKLNDFVSEYRMKLECLNVKIAAMNTSEKILEEEKDYIDQKIRSYYGCETLIEAEQVIEQAQSFIKNYGFGESFLLYDLNKKIDSLTKEIIKEEEKIRELEQIENVPSKTI